MAFVFATLQAVDAALATSGTGTVDLGAAFGGAGVARVSLAGTNTTSSFGTVPGKSRMMRFLSATPLVNGAALALIGNANRTTSPGSVGFYASDAAGNWTELAYAPGDTALIASGTAMLFMQAAAPTGWTKSAAHDNKALRIVSGATGGSAGGSAAFTTVFGAGKATGGAGLVGGNLPNVVVGGHALTPGEAPALKLTDGGTNAQLDTAANSPGGFAVISYDTSNGAAHDHPAGYDGSTGSAHSHTLPLDLQYVDAIVATKD